MIRGKMTESGTRAEHLENQVNIEIRIQEDR